MRAAAIGPNMPAGSRTPQGMPEIPLEKPSVTRPATSQGTQSSANANATKIATFFRTIFDLPKA